MKIQGLEDITNHELSMEIQNGGKFVIFQYCISVVLLTFKRSSDIYFIRADESPGKQALPFTLISIFLGWWGIPWGPIYTIQSLHTNFTGGKDVTQPVLSALANPNPGGQS
ncbi:MAG: hypothetical protein AAF215_19035 [Cyanobacteria bacterium P01_A01_bin.123]